MFKYNFVLQNFIEFIDIMKQCHIWCLCDKKIVNSDRDISSVITVKLPWVTVITVQWFSEQRCQGHIQSGLTFVPMCYSVWVNIFNSTGPSLVYTTMRSKNLTCISHFSALLDDLFSLKNSYLIVSKGCFTSAIGNNSLHKVCL